MIFQHTHEKVLSGEKIQTRRFVKKGDMPLGEFSSIEAVAARSGKAPNERMRIRWEVGHTYAVQPGRGQKQVGRIRITGIRREDVRRISTEDAQAEGFYTPLHFLRTWASMHDKAFPETEYLADSVDRYLDRPAHLYDAWVIEFELVEATS